MDGKERFGTVPGAVATGSMAPGRYRSRNGNIPQESTVRASKGRALQLAHGLDFLSIQAYRLWMEYPSRER